MLSQQRILDLVICRHLERPSWSSLSKERRRRIHQSVNNRSFHLETPRSNHFLIEPSTRPDRIPSHLHFTKRPDMELFSLHFIIMDERSKQDDTVLLVTAPYKEWPLTSVRATFEASASALDLYLTGHSDPEEHAWYAEATNNVYCGPEISRRDS